MSETECNCDMSYGHSDNCPNKWPDLDTVERWWVYSGELEPERPKNDDENLYVEVVPAAALDRAEAERDKLAKIAARYVGTDVDDILKTMRERLATTERSDDDQR